jgi:hypothetical protein
MTNIPKLIEIETTHDGLPSFRRLAMIFLHFVAKYFFASKAGCPEDCLKFKMPKMPKIEVFSRFYLNFTC